MQVHLPLSQPVYYFILWLGAWDQLLGNYNGICIMSLGFMMSRCLSGIGVITFPKARTDGTVAEFSRNASEIAVRNVLITMFVILAALMIWVDPVLGVLAAVSALLVFWWYHHMALKYFGGTTGDSFRIFPLHLRGRDGTGACSWWHV